MKTVKRYGALVLIATGAVTLTATRLPSWSGSNTLLLIGLLLIVAGIMMHIRTIKQESNY